MKHAHAAWDAAGDAEWALQHEHEAWKYNMDGKHGHTSMEMQHRHASWACNMHNLQHEHVV
jgi:hypothetical protein